MMTGYQGKICKECRTSIKHRGEFCSSKCRYEYNKKYNKHICDLCNQLKYSNARNGDGYICTTCDRNRKTEICSICRKDKIVAIRDENKLAICHSCRGELNKEICSICNKIKKVSVRDKNNNPVCCNCSVKLYIGLCLVCNKEKPLIHYKNICKNCDKNNSKVLCSLCSKSCQVSSRDTDGNPICNRCTREKNKRQCHICETTQLIVSSKNNIDVCASCYVQISKQNCEICKNYRTCYKQGCFIICKSCNIYLKQGFSFEEISKIKRNKHIHHIIFEEIINNFISEPTISYLISNNYFKYDIDINKRLRYDYFLPENSILVEINEPCHYDFGAYKKTTSNHGTLETFQKYQNRFQEKVRLAKENRIDLLIIDIEYKMEKIQLIKLFEEKLDIYSRN